MNFTNECNTLSHNSQAPTLLRSHGPTGHILSFPNSNPVLVLGNEIMERIMCMRASGTRGRGDVRGQDNWGERGQKVLS